MASQITQTNQSLQNMIIYHNEIRDSSWKKSLRIPKNLEKADNIEAFELRINNVNQNAVTT